MSYLKGKDIKCPFDCLWHYYTRRFEPLATGTSIHVDRYHIDYATYPTKYMSRPPTELEKW